MNLIAAVDKNWGIGYKNQLLVRIPEDMKSFRTRTTGKVLIMGRTTLETFPNKRPLKDRTNIILTLERDYEARGAVVVHSIEEALEETEQYPSEDVFVVGGASIYTQMLAYCDTAYITKINHAYKADKFIPNLDEIYEWEIESVSKEKTYYDLDYAFYKYVKKF